MLACVYRSGVGLELSEVDPPRPEEFGAVMKVLACSICGTDARTFRSKSGSISDRTAVGHETVGILTAVRPGMPGGFQRGDRVAVAPAVGCGECRPCKNGKTNMCDRLKTVGFQYGGGFAAEMGIPEQAFRMGNVYKVPETVPDLCGTLAEPLACVLNAQSYLQIQPGETVAIFGSGVIGCLHAEVARTAGASRILIVEPSRQRIRQAEALAGGAEFLCPDDSDVEREIFRRTGGNGADVAIIACSSGAAQEQGLRALAKCGRISLFGGLPGGSNGHLDSNLIHYRELGVFGVHASTSAQNREAMRLMESGVVNAEKYISRTYKLPDIFQAFQDVQDGRVMKAVILPNENE